MLKRVEIKQFRSCRDVVLDNLGPVTVLAGRNAVGKTNILRAINWLAGTATSAAVPHAQRGKGRISLQATVGQTTYHYDFEVHDSPARSQIPAWQRGSVVDLVEELFSEESDGVRLPVFNRQNEEVRLPYTKSIVKIGAAGPCMPALMSLLPADSPDLVLIRPFLSFLERIRYYPFDATDTDVLPSMILQDAYNEWLSRYDSTGDSGDSALLRLVHLKLTDQPQFEEIRSLLGPNGLGLLDDIRMHVLEVPMSTDRKKELTKWYMFEFRPTLQSPEAPKSSGYYGFEGLSAGTQRVIRIIVSLIFDQSEVMLLEHPEDSIHRGLLRKLIGVLQSYSDQSQVITSSHSSVVFNTLDPGAVRLVTMEDGNTKVRALTPEELSIAGRYLEEEGSLSEFLEMVEED